MDRETLLRAADLALYRAKREGRGRVCFFEPGLETELQEKTRLEADLRAAVAEGAFVPQYRALANLRDGTTHGFELRPYWNNPMPSEVYLALAGQLGILSDLMWPLMRQACRDARSWPGETVLVVNLAPVQLRDPALPTQILHVLAQENFLPSRLEMQIPELTLIAEMEPVEATLLAFQSAGIRISIGDFGTGLSRMCRFDNVRFETVKIGDAFARSLSGGGRSDGLVGSVLALARNLGRAAAADGIETTETSSRLSSLGCDLGQGLLFGRALLGSEVGLPVAANIG
jgi:predicted signal transduction protein with EAL and GGDEF domain